MATLPLFDCETGVFYIYDIVADAEVTDKQLCHIYIRLLAARHQHADDPVLAQRLNAERRDDRAVLAAGYSDNGVAALSVFLKEIAYPLYAVVFYLFSVKHNLLLYLDLAAFHSVERRPVKLWGDSRAAGGVDGNFRLGEMRF